ncbi:hypothetical protein J5T34_19645 [Cupriavidus gilardii]|uniref:hypothetical protein n=1 Tax=Cupriavidus gilardii TaxID=82541 RepID=UPI001ABDEDE8|nr:hypothetical protein [Cupriavidus gilardii]MBO4122944.1 hypothetical protein [Cupriavidus gilardii]
MSTITDLSASHQRAVQALQLFKHACETDDIRRALHLTLRGNTYRITYTPRRELSRWNRVLSWLGMERRTAVRRLPPDPQVLRTMGCHAVIASESGWLRTIAKRVFGGRLEHAAVRPLNEAQRRDVALRAAVEFHADCDVGVVGEGPQVQALLYGPSPTKANHWQAFSQARAQRIEPEPWADRVPPHAPCYAVPAAAVTASREASGPVVKEESERVPQQAAVQAR